MNSTGTHLRGDYAELKIAGEAFKRGYKVSFPFGHDSHYDLIVDRNNILERVQVKCIHSDGKLLKIPGRSIGKENGKSVRRNYTPDTIEWLSVFDEFDEECYFIPSSILGTKGKDYISLRIAPTKNNQTKNVLWAKDFKDW